MPQSVVVVWTKIVTMCVVLDVIFTGRGRPRKKVIYEEIDDRTSESDTDIADSQYSGSTVVNSPMSLSTEAEEFEIQINDDDDSDIEVSFVFNMLGVRCYCPHCHDLGSEFHIRC